MKYWMVSQNVMGGDDVSAWEKAIVDNNRAFVGRSAEEGTGVTFANVDIGDLILIAKKPNSNKVVLLCGIAAAKAKTEHLPGTPDVAQNIKLEYVLTKSDIDRLDLVFDNTCLYRDSPRPFAIAEMKLSNSGDKKNIDKLLTGIKNKKTITEMENKLKLLQLNYQIILTGAPGTGKTYLAKKIAKEIVKMDNEANSTESYFDEHISFVQFHPSYDYTDFMEGLRPHKEDGKEMGFKLKNGIFKEFCIKANKEENKKAKYVFIIDEINRGDISKIFGELFFALDPGYRGNKGKIRTQYHNINEKEDFVDFGTFFVPDNIYIIGTMNDIDRSVESFDFAMRRRFAWIEITPEDSVSMWNNQIESYKEKAMAKMTALNDLIKRNENLGSAFQIGPAYFLKLKNYDGQFDKLWKFHIEILLKEYLRGLPMMEEQLKELKTAYDEAA